MKKSLKITMNAEWPKSGLLRKSNWNQNTKKYSKIFFLYLDTNKRDGILNQQSV